MRLTMKIAALGLAMVLGGVTAAAAENGQPKWGAHGSVFAGGGSDGGYGGLEAFVPVWQDMTSMMFLDVRGRLRTEDEADGSFGLAYRTMTANGEGGDGWIFGLNAFFDITRTSLGNTYKQVGGGIEFFNDDWEFRANGYYPLDDPESLGVGMVVLGDMNQVGIRVYRERPLHGIDGEVGALLTRWASDGPYASGEVRVFAGGFYFGDDEIDFYGPHGGIEIRLYDIDGLPEGSRVTVGADGRWDDVRGSHGEALVRLRVPFGYQNYGVAPLDGLNRRMVDRIRRRPGVTSRVVLTAAAEPAQFDDGRPVSNLIYADGTTMGDGLTPPTAADIADAVTLATENGIIVALDQTGDLATDGVTLLPGQTLVGGGTELWLQTAAGDKAPLLLDGAPGTIAGSAASTVLTAVDNTLIWNVNLSGGSTGLHVTGQNVMANMVGISGVSSLNDAFGVLWEGAGGKASNLMVGNVNGGQTLTVLGTAGIAWTGDNGMLTDSTIGNVTANASPFFGAVLANGLAWSGNNGMVDNLTIGDVTSDGSLFFVNAAKGVLWTGDDGTMTNFAFGNVNAMGAGSSSTAAGIDVQGDRNTFQMFTGGTVQSSGSGINNSFGLAIFGGTDGNTFTDGSLGPVTSTGTAFDTLDGGTNTTITDVTFP